MSRPPIMADLYKPAREELDQLGYRGDVHANLCSALELRVGDLNSGAIGRIFSTLYSNPSIENLASKFTLVELGGLANRVAKLIPISYLMALRRYLLLNPLPKNWPPGKPRLIIVLEEAHLLFARTGGPVQSEHFADTAAFISMFIAALMVEMRALGVGIIIVDQHPTRVAIEAIKSTATKLSFRQVDLADRRILADASVMNELDLEELAQLMPGLAYLYTEGYRGPRRIKAVDYRSLFGTNDPPTDQELQAILNGEAWYRRGREERARAELELITAVLDEFDDSRLQVLRGAKELKQRMDRAAQGTTPARRRELSVKHATRAMELKQRMNKLYEGLAFGFQRAMIENPEGWEGCCVEIEEARRAVQKRFNETVIARTREFIQEMNRLIERCEQISTEE